MHSGLSQARALAESIRYKGDSPRASNSAASRSSDALTSFFRHNELRICDEITPALYDVLTKTATRLFMVPEQIEAYVYESPGVQASCLVSESGCCLIRASSGLVSLLSADELAFVLGHEIGHHLLGHAHVEPELRSPEEQLAARASEISADRIGLVACGSIEVASRALMKSLSGLPDGMIRFDVSRYLSQFADSTLAGASSHLSHPTMGVRCRALLWFASAMGAEVGTVDARQRAIVDDRVGRDLHRFIDHEINDQIQAAERSVALWTAVVAIVLDGRMSKAERLWLEANFGFDSVAKVVRLLGGSTMMDAQQFAESRRTTAIQRLKSLVPNSWQERQSAANALAASKPD